MLVGRFFVWLTVIPGSGEQERFERVFRLRLLRNGEGNDDAGAGFGVVGVGDRTAKFVAAGDVDQVHAGFGGGAPVEFGGEAGAVVVDFEAGDAFADGECQPDLGAAMSGGVGEEFGDEQGQRACGLDGEAEIFNLVSEAAATQGAPKQQEELADDGLRGETVCLDAGLGIGAQ